MGRWEWKEGRKGEEEERDGKKEGGEEWKEVRKVEMELPRHWKLNHKCHIMKGVAQRILL